MTDFNPCVHLEAVREIAHTAGRRILDVYEREFKVEHKEDRSPLTEADRAAHEIITSQLQALTPDIPVLSEESAAIDYDTRAGWKRFWLTIPSILGPITIWCMPSKPRLILRGHWPRRNG